MTGPFIHRFLFLHDFDGDISVIPKNTLAIKSGIRKINGR